jgi:hypothetical protein
VVGFLRRNCHERKGIAGFFDAYIWVARLMPFDALWSVSVSACEHQHPSRRTSFRLPGR